MFSLGGAPQRNEIFKQNVNDCVQHIVLQKFTNFHAIRSWNFRIFAMRWWPRFYCATLYTHMHSERGSRASVYLVSGDEGFGLNFLKQNVSRDVNNNNNNNNNNDKYNNNKPTISRTGNILLVSQVAPVLTEK